MTYFKQRGVILLSSGYITNKGYTKTTKIVFPNGYANNTQMKKKTLIEAPNLHYQAGIKTNKQLNQSFPNGYIKRVYNKQLVYEDN